MGGGYIDPLLGPIYQTMQHLMGAVPNDELKIISSIVPYKPLKRARRA